VRIAGADARRSLTILEAAAGIAAAQAEFAEAVASDDSAVDSDDDTDADEDIGADEDIEDSTDSEDSADTDDSEASPAEGTAILITEAACAEASSETVLRYDKNGDQHYDVVSAFIKSIRGSDVDAALHYLARMIVAGEDPRFIARRVVISAAEDIGMADPQALPIAVAASTAVQNIGMPEGRIPLAEAVTYLAMAPKSNASYRALDAAIADVKNGFSGQVPTHLRDAHYPGAKELGHGEGYKYSHDHPHGVAAQEYLPETLRGKRYYEPTGNGMERSLGERLEMLQRLLRP
ncbi:MAG: replication-associated recombination protein A, partial [Brevibacterium aurantiacum]